MTPDELRQEYLTLLDKEENEQVYQDYLQANTRLIPRSFVLNHGIHLRSVLRKLPLHSEHITDFFFLSKSSKEWHCVFIEIEKPSSKFFQGNSLKYHGDFRHALEQVNSWRAWCANPDNWASFINNVIGDIRVPLKSISSTPKYILVHGRRKEYQDNQKRIDLLKAEHRSDFEIMSFDSLAESLKVKEELYVVIRKNDHFEFLTEEFLGDGAFEWLPTSIVRIKPSLKQELCDQVQEIIDTLSKMGDPMSKFNLAHQESRLKKFESLTTT